MDPVVEPESLETCPDLNNPVLHVLVIGFHHKKGCQVEYAYPPLIPGGSSSSCELPSQWKHLPSLALPDGSHNFDNDTAYFHLPDLENPRKTSKENLTEIIKFLFSSAARFGNLSPFRLLFEPFGDQYFALAAWQFGKFLGYFWKIVKKPV